MKTKIASLLVAGLLLAAPTAQAAEWSDNSLHYWVGTTFREPAVPVKLTKNIFSFEHVSGWKYGSNFLNVDFLLSSKSDSHFNAQTGAAEVYAVYRTTLSYSKISGTKLELPGIRDFGLELGFDGNTKNNSFGSKKLMPIGSLKLSFNVPGFFDVGVGVAKEWNVNGLNFGNKHEVTFDATPVISTAWGIHVAGPVAFEGFGNVVFPKGKDTFGAKTKTEILLHPKLMVDVASLWDSKGLQAGVGFQYWLNKFGNDHGLDSSGGSYEKAAFLEAAVHL